MQFHHLHYAEFGIVQTLFSIVKELDGYHGVFDEEIIKVNLPVGLPPKQYGSLYRKFEEYLSRNDMQDVSYRGKKYAIYINNVMAFPQDYAAAMTIYGKLKGYVKVVVIDMGGFTLDYLLMLNGQPYLGVFDSLDNGIIKLYNSSASRINSEYDILLEETDIDQIIRNQHSDYEPEVIRIVQEMAKLFAEDFLGSLRERGIDLKSGCVVFIGGGSLLLEKHIRESRKVGKCIFIPDLQANAKGYGILYQLQKGR